MFRMININSPMNHRASATRSRISVRISLLSIEGADEVYETQLIGFKFDEGTCKRREDELDVSRKLMAVAISFRFVETVYS